MPALPADIVRATRRARIVTREDTSLLDRFPNARDQANSPEPGFFENASDAQTVLAIKAHLTGSFRRRFALIIDGAENERCWIDPVDCIPTHCLTDNELAIDAPTMVTRWQIDLNQERVELEVLG